MESINDLYNNVLNQSLSNRANAVFNYLWDEKTTEEIESEMSQFKEFVEIRNKIAHPELCSARPDDICIVQGQCWPLIEQTTNVLARVMKDPKKFDKES